MFFLEAVVPRAFFSVVVELMAVCRSRVDSEYSDWLLLDNCKVGEQAGHMMQVERVGNMEQVGLAGKIAVVG